MMQHTINAIIKATTVPASPAAVAPHEEANSPPLFLCSSISCPCVDVENQNIIDAWMAQII